MCVERLSYCFYIVQSVYPFLTAQSSETTKNATTLQYFAFSGDQRVPIKKKRDLFNSQRGWGPVKFHMAAATVAKGTQ